MKLISYIIVIVSLSMLAWNAPHSSEPAGENPIETVNSVIQDTAKQDSTEYKLVVFDGGFETWYIQRDLPSSYHSEQYYEHWNQRYVNEWNYRYSLGDSRFTTSIDYDPSKDYGIELEHKLYYFFKYFEEKNNISLIR